MANSIFKEQRHIREQREIEINRKNPKITEVILSRERTFLSYQRMCIAKGSLAVGIAALGFGLIRIFETSRHAEIMLSFGIVFLGIATAVALFAWRRYRRYGMYLDKLCAYRGKLHKVYFDEMDTILDGEDFATS